MASKLREFGCDEVVTGCGETGVVGVIVGTSGLVSKTIGFRTDMDALPIHNRKSVSGAAQFQNELAEQTCQKKDKQYQAAGQDGRFGTKHCGLSSWGGRENNSC